VPGSLIDVDHGGLGLWGRVVDLKKMQHWPASSPLSGGDSYVLVLPGAICPHQSVTLASLYHCTLIWT
jgi:hypothetical protein